MRPGGSVFLVSGLLALGLGCHKLDEEAGSAGLYVYDGNSKAVLAWKDISPSYDAGSVAAPDRTLTGTLLNASIGLGGMALDSSAQYLFLVAATGGTVVRINRASEQNGALSQASDIFSFTLKDTGTDAQGGTFGQVSVDPSGQYLYVTQATTDKSQIWAVPYGRMSSGAQIDGTTSGIIIAHTNETGGTSDTGATGVAAGTSGAVYGFFSGGGNVSDGINTYAGPRLRKGAVLGFSPNAQVLVGSQGTTQLGLYGSLAYDTGNDRLYAARHNTDSGLTGNPVLVYTPGSFNPGFQKGPEATLSGPSSLRLLAHAGRKDWLAGALSSAGNTLLLWRKPSTDDALKSLSLPDTASGAVQIRGLALDGSD